MKRHIVCAAAGVLTLLCSFTLTACTTKESFDISVSAEITNGVVYALQPTAKTGEKVRLACLPDVGYKLINYSVNGKAIEGNTFAMPDGNVEVSADFAAITYAVEYVLNGGTVNGTNPSMYTVADGNISLTAPHKDGFEFGVWYYRFGESKWQFDELDDFKTDKILQGTTGKLTLYAHYYNVPHDIIEDDTLENGYVYASNYQAEEGETIYLYGGAYDYYEFICYTVDGEELESDNFIMPNHAVKVSAKIKPIEYYITYELNEGANSPENPDTFNIETSFELRPAHKDGYTFIGWYYYFDGYYTLLTSLDALYYYGDVTLYAEFEEIIE